MLSTAVGRKSRYGSLSPLVSLVMELRAFTHVLSISDYILCPMFDFLDFFFYLNLA